MKNPNDLMKRHLGNISRYVGHDVSNNYSYIISKDELTNAYLQFRNDLGYPLMVDSKYRRAIVYNKEGLEKKINDIIIQNISESMGKMFDMMIDDVVNEINNRIDAIGTGGSRTTKTMSNNKNINKFASMLSKGIVKSVTNLFEEVWNDRDSRI